MSLASWLSLARSRSQRRNPALRPRKARLLPEHLEARALLASYTAANVSALIADINSSNTAGGSNTITLTAPTTSPYIVTSASTTDSGTGLPDIAPNDNLTIVGNGDTIERSTAAGTPDFRLLAVASGASLTLGNLTLQGGYSLPWGGGGAIYNQGTLVLNGVTVQGNTANAVFGDGGGVYSTGSLTLEGGSIVRNNAATFGGGLYVFRGTVNVTNTMLESNVANQGGGLYVYGYGSTTVTLNNDTIESNQASYGGGLYVSVYGKTVTLNNVTFASNHALGGEGGGLYVVGGNVALNNDTVDSNTATVGGGLYIGGGTVTLADDSVVTNTAVTAGGGLYVKSQPANSGPAAIVTLTNDTVESNTTGGYGGGIDIGSPATVYLDSFTVANTINNTDKSGLNGSTANIDGTYILT